MISSAWQLSVVLCLVLINFANAVHGDHHNHTGVLKELDGLRANVKEMFMHGFNSYMNHAYPADELKPLSCKPRWRQEGKSGQGGVDLVMGRYQLTLIDSLDTLYMMDEKELWKDHVRKVIATAKFDADLPVSVFEANIRILGGLLSNHLFCVDENMVEEADSLLKMAQEVADRLLPAFDTPTGIPLSQVNLKTGTVPGQTRGTCTACGGTYILEFGLLSKLVDDNKYYEAAMKALESLDTSSSSLSFMGAQIDVDDGSWLFAASGIGAGVDSLYEYLLKAFILFGDDYFYAFFVDVYTRVMAGTWIEDWYLQTNIQNAGIVATWTDSLGAFWPGLQVLLGDLASARSGFDKFWSIWKKFGAGLPERFDVSTSKAVIAHSALRPELVESAYMLYTATKDPFYIHAGAEMMRSYEKYSRVPCGYASLASVVSKQKEDKMESFFLSETLKYLYLLFTPDHPMNSGNYVFTTEAHPIRVSQPWRHKEAINDNLPPSICKAPSSCQIGFNHTSCSFNNTIYLQESRKFGSKTYQLHFIMDGIRHSDVKNIGANVLPSDREIIVTAIGPEPEIYSFYTIRGAFGGTVGESTVAKEIAFAEPKEACTALSNADELVGKVAVAYRGGCTFSDKALILEQAGASAVIFVNNVETAVFTMSDDKWHPSPVKIPLTLMSQEDGTQLAEMARRSAAQGNARPMVSFASAHPHNELGVLQFFLQLHPGVPTERQPPIGFASSNKAFKYGDGFVLMSSKVEDHAFQQEWTGSNFQVFVSNDTAPFRITRAVQ